MPVTNPMKIPQMQSLVILIVVILHNLLGYLLGYLTGVVFRMSLPRKKALSIEIGMQNSGLATTLAASAFPDMAMATVPGADCHADAERHVHSGHCNDHTALSCLAYRIEASRQRNLLTRRTSFRQIPLRSLYRQPYKDTGLLKPPHEQYDHPPCSGRPLRYCLSEAASSLFRQAP